MANVKNIFGYIQGMNPTVTTISSMGSFVENRNQQVADMAVREVIDAIENHDSLAYKIATSTTRFFSEKQLWVIAYELMKNKEFVAMVENFYAEIERKENAKREASRQKLAANKANSQNVLDYVKAQGRKLGDYYKFVKSNKGFAREFFSKKYTMESAIAFINA